MTNQSTLKRVRPLVVAITLAMVATMVLAIAPGTASAAPKFSCSVDAEANLKWDDNGADKYWVYRSADGGTKYEWIGRTLGDTTFTDDNAPAGALYQVHYQGISRTNCDGSVVIVNNPAPEKAPFNCAVNNGSISWSDHQADKYWVYRSLDGGSKYEWLGRTLGDTKMIDPQAAAGALYQVHYSGIPRVNCAGTNPAPIPAPATAVPVAPTPVPATPVPVVPVVEQEPEYEYPKYLDSIRASGGAYNDVPSGDKYHSSIKISGGGYNDSVGNGAAGNDSTDYDVNDVVEQESEYEYPKYLDSIRASGGAYNDVPSGDKYHSSIKISGGGYNDSVGNGAAGNDVAGNSVVGTDYDVNDVAEQAPVSGYFDYFDRANYDLGYQEADSPKYLDSIQASGGAYNDVPSGDKYHSSIKISGGGYNDSVGNGAAGNDVAGNSVVGTDYDVNDVAEQAPVSGYFDYFDSSNYDLGYQEADSPKYLDSIQASGGAYNDVPSGDKYHSSIKISGGGYNSSNG